MIRFGNNLLLNLVIAACAVFAGGETGFKAGCAFCRKLYNVMSESRNCFGIAFGAVFAGAGICANAGFKAGRFFCNDGSIGMFMVAEKNKLAVIFFGVALSR